MVSPFSFNSLLSSAPPRKIIIDQDCSGPATTNTVSVLLLLLASQLVEIVGITIATGDAFALEESLHCLRLLELLNRTDIPLYVGSPVPLLATPARLARWVACLQACTRLH